MNLVCMMALKLTIYQRNVGFIAIQQEKKDYIFFDNSGVDIHDSRFFVIIIRDKRMVEKIVIKCERNCAAKIFAVTKKSTCKLNVRRNDSKKRQINHIIVLHMRSLLVFKR